MAKDTANPVNVVMEIKENHKDLLGSIRHWDNLKMAKEGNTFWIKDFKENQLSSLELKSISLKQLYELRDNLLFPQGSQLPFKKMPSSLLWSPIERALPIEMPALNNNYFGIQQSVEIGLVKKNTEQNAIGLFTTIAALGKYLESAPAIRFSGLQWVIVHDKALVLGSPLLPIQGGALWKRENFLVPAGYDFDLPILAGVFSEKINNDNQNWVWFKEDGSFMLIDKSKFKPLSISSFRLSVKRKQ